MARCELWPPAQYFETLSASEIIDRLPRVQKKLKTTTAMVTIIAPSGKRWRVWSKV